MTKLYVRVMPLAMKAEIAGRFGEAETHLLSLLQDPETKDGYGVLIRESLAQVYHKMGRHDVARSMLLELAATKDPEGTLNRRIRLAQAVAYRLDDADLVLDLMSQVGPPDQWPVSTTPLRAWIAWKTNAPEATDLSITVLKHCPFIDGIIEKLFVFIATRAPEHLPVIADMLDRLEQSRQDHAELVAYWRKKLLTQA